MNTPIADMVAEMSKLGTPIETIILAVRTTELALRGSRPVDEAAENRRAWDREYRRNRKANPPEIHPIPPDHASLSKDSKKLAEAESKKERKSRGTKIPPDWQPKDFHYAEGEKRGMSRAAVDDLGESLRIWCASKANSATTTRADWDATFTQWIRRERSNGNGFNGLHANTAAGRANAKEASFVTALGRGAANILGKNNASGLDRASSGSHDAPQIDDFSGRAKGHA